MTIIPTWAKALAVLAAVVALGLAWNAFLDYEQGIGYDRRKAEDNVALIAAQDAAKIETERLNKEKNDAIAARITAENKGAISAAAVAAANLQLRDARARLRDSLSNSTIEACRATVAAYDFVFGECTSRLETVARSADGHYADTVMLK